MNNNSTFQKIVDFWKEPIVIDNYQYSEHKNKKYQSEQELENNLIQNLQNLGYEYIKSLNSENQLILNLRKQIEKLNNIQFDEKEWQIFFNEYLCNQNENNIIDKSKKIHKDYIYELKRSDGSLKNIKIIDKENIFNNHLQVINQCINNKNRYDVTILVNGLPLVHIELKKRGINIQEAFNQIQRYKNESFSNHYGLFNYVQLFIISNGTSTKYFSNTVYQNHINHQQNNKNITKTSNSFAFTSYWADAKNNKIEEIEDFTKYFLNKRTLLKVLIKFCVLTTKNVLMVMRPYQIIATEKVINKIIMSHNLKKYGSKQACGYVWHTTGSGKTLTSFKISQLIANELPFIDKVLFVVDRKDLDYQTMAEYDKFEKGCANSNTNTNILTKQLLSNDNKIIITTIQKLNNFINKQNKINDNKLANKEIVFIFDECHRSQFGLMHKNITNYFKNYYLFGFTGTPIFDENKQNNNCNNKLIHQAITKKSINEKTTQELFGDCLHEYNILDAMKDQSVLPFKYDEINYNYSPKDKINDNEKGTNIDYKKIYMHPERIENNVKYIIENYDRFTLNKSFNNKKTKNGFNSILATDSIDSAISYYHEFKKQLKLQDNNLKVAIIFSCVPNEEQNQVLNNSLIDDENNESVASLSQNHKEFLKSAIDDYNKMFNTNWNINDQKFQEYYKNVSQKLRNNELDILIVVNMFLTGFDAPELNTLWIDKNVKMHGLIQAFSRTNRILNNTKKYGQIVSFRSLQKQYDEALSLFSSQKDAKKIMQKFKSFDEYYNGYNEDNHYYEGYKNIVNQLLNDFPYQKRLINDDEKQAFIKLFGKFLKLYNILNSFSEFNNEKRLINDFDLQNFTSRYNEYYEEIKKGYNVKKIDISDDLVYEIDLVHHFTQTIDQSYILNEIKKLNKNAKNKQEIIDCAKMMITCNPQLHSKKELIIKFINEQINKKNNFENINNEEVFSDFCNDQKNKDIESIVNEFDLDPKKTNAFVENCIENNEFKNYGNSINELYNKKPSYFSPSSTSIKQDKENLIKKLLKVYETYK